MRTDYLKMSGLLIMASGIIGLADIQTKATYTAEQYLTEQKPKNEEERRIFSKYARELKLEEQLKWTTLSYCGALFAGAYVTARGREERKR